LNNLNDRIEQVLNDPESLKQISEIASAMGFLDQSQTMEVPAPEITKNLSTVMEQLHQRDQKQENLIHALLPYLKPAKRQRLERAMQIAQLSQLAGAAISSDKISIVQEALRHV